MQRRIKGSISSKLYGFENILGPLVANACIGVCPKNAANFNVDNVRVTKIPGSGPHKSQLVHGVVIRREPEGSIRLAKKAKVAVFAQGVDTNSTETKVTCHLSQKNASRLRFWSQRSCVHLHVIASCKMSRNKIAIGGKWWADVDRQDLDIASAFCQLSYCSKYHRLVQSDSSQRAFEEFMSKTLMRVTRLQSTDRQDPSFSPVRH